MLMNNPKPIDKIHTNYFWQNYSTMKFISQTSANADGNYTMTWKAQDGNTVITEHNLFNW